MASWRDPSGTPHARVGLAAQARDGVEPLPQSGRAAQSTPGRDAGRLILLDQRSRTSRPVAAAALLATSESDGWHDDGDGPRLTRSSTQARRAGCVTSPARCASDHEGRSGAGRNAAARAWLLRTWRRHAGAVTALLSEAVATRRAARSLRSFRASGATGDRVAVGSAGGAWAARRSRLTWFPAVARA
jgi:hypothetical protein